MSDLLIEDIDDELVTDLRLLALRSGRTFDEEVVYRLALGLEIERKATDAPPPSLRGD